MTIAPRSSGEAEEFNPVRRWKFRCVGGAVPNKYGVPKGSVQLARDVQVQALSDDEEAVFQQWKEINCLSPFLFCFWFVFFLKSLLLKRLGSDTTWSWRWEYLSNMAGQCVVKTFLNAILLDEASKSALVVLFLVHGGKKISFKRFKYSSPIPWSQANICEVVTNSYQVFTRSYSHVDLKLHKRGTHRPHASNSFQVFFK